MGRRTAEQTRTLQAARSYFLYRIVVQMSC
jgi:hypothetical protein